MYLIKLIKIFNLLIIFIVILLIIWINIPCYVQSGVAEIAPDNIKKAMKKMGPYYDYKMIEDKLYVKLEGKWRRLRYDK